MDINNIKPILNEKEILILFPNIPKRFFKFILNILIEKQIERKNN